MKRNKGIVLVGTIVIVLLGLFLGLKFTNKPGNKVGTNVNNTKVAAESKKKEEQKDNFLSQSLREEKERKDKDKDEEDKDLNREQEKDTLKEEDLKEDNKEENTKEEREEKSKTTNAKGIEVYDDKYVVKKGDTLFSIAKQYFDKDNVNKAVGLIKEINKIDKSVLIKEGDKLLIPTEDNLKGEKQRKTQNIKGNDNEKQDTKDGKDTSSKGKAYIVKKGDNLTKIVKENMNWCTKDKAIKLLIENNDLKNANDIKENQKIYIPLQK